MTGARPVGGGAALLVLLAACGGGGATGTGGAGGSTAPTTSAGSSSSGAGGAGGAPLDVAQAAFPDLTTLHATGVAATCALNQGVCHSQRQWPELGTMAALLAAVGAPCQVGIQDPASTLAACEIPGDKLRLGGQDYEILHVDIAPGQPFPPAQVTLKLPAVPASMDPATAHLHRPDGMGGDLFDKPLTGTTLAAGADVVHLVVTLAGATDATLAGFLDTRAWHGDRVRQGDANGDGMAHVAAQPWAEITPGDPARSLLYQRLVSEAYGPRMPLVPRTWSPAATRALWCWIRGLPAGATAASIDPAAPIAYADCPVDPAAPDPNAVGGWPAVKMLLAGKCATGPCHSAETHAAMLDLSPDEVTFAKNVVNVASSQSPGVLRVVPGQPAASYLLCKVNPKCDARAAGTVLMPQGATPLSDTEIQTISDWILAGAPTK
jgi:hypothetical protein